MHDTDVRTLIMEHLVAGVASARKCFDAKTGRFLAENGGWAVTQQDVIYSLALLCTTEHPANPFHDDEEIFNMACRGGDALRDWQDEEGRFEFIRPNGTRWGKIYMPWSMYHWLEAYALLRKHLRPERAAAWEEGLRMAFNGTATIYGTAEKIHNIAAWHSMALVRAGEVFAESRWRDIGTRYIRHVVALQHPDGYWPEGAGPTVVYNLVYVHSIGLYYHFTGDESVLPAVERALDFHLRFSYPNGACVETIDGRCKYTGLPKVIGIPAFAVFPPGRRFARFQTVCARRHAPNGDLEPHLTSAFVHFQDGDEETIPQEQESFVAVHNGRALVRRRGPWFYCLSAYATPTEALSENWHSRWRMDRQNLLSVWHDRLGLIIGGGSSKNQPEFSTFAVVEGRARWVQPCEAVVSADDEKGDHLELKYGSAGCALVVRSPAPDVLEMVFRADAAAHATSVRGGFTLRLPSGTTIESSGADGAFTVDARTAHELQWPASDKSTKRWIKGEGWRLHLPAGSSFSWPVYPFNPYAIDNVAPREQAVARVSAQLIPGGPAKRLTLRVNA